MIVSVYFIVGLFILYYLLVIFLEKKIIQDPKDIIEKFLSVILLYGGISLVHFSLTGKPFLGDSIENYSVYIFVIGFIAMLWTIPNLLKEFAFFKKFLAKNENKIPLLTKQTQEQTQGQKPTKTRKKKKEF
ncbi:MAG: hypothetical protein KJ767_01165 [Nanoarchaeota archaeon]|nr:hypothetical protein [Nanoarchaeota archaeon]